MKPYEWEITVILEPNRKALISGSQPWGETFLLLLHNAMRNWVLRLGLRFVADGDKTAHKTRLEHPKGAITVTAHLKQSHIAYETWPEYDRIIVRLVTCKEPPADYRDILQRCIEEQENFATIVHWECRVRNIITGQ